MPAEPYGPTTAGKIMGAYGNGADWVEPASRIICFRLAKCIGRDENAGASPDRDGSFCGTMGEDELFLFALFVTRLTLASCDPVESPPGHVAP